MKKSTIFVMLLLAAMLLGITMAASAESRGDHWASINVALEKLEGALDRGDRKAANSALADVRVRVYAGLRYLTSIQAYDARAMSIIEFATQAMNSNNYEYLIAQAHAMNFLVFGEGTGGTTVSSHS